MSALAKGLTIGVLMSASLAAPITAMVSYIQTRPDSTPLLPPIPTELKHEPLAATISEPTLAELEPLVIEPSKPRAATAGKKPSRQPPRDPAKFELELPRVDRPQALGLHNSSSPSVDSRGMPPPVARAEKRTLVYEEQLR
jgi:hypothetical protein